MKRSQLKRYTKLKAKPYRLDPGKDGVAWWKSRREEAFDRDHWMCRRCGSDRQLDAAHVIGLGRGRSRYNQREPRNALVNICTLCRDCHQGQTLGKWQWSEIFIDVAAIAKEIGTIASLSSASSAFAVRWLR